MILLAAILMPLIELERLASLARGGDIPARNAIVTAHFPIVGIVVAKMMRRGFTRRPSLFGWEEAQSEGHLALLWIAGRWEPGRASFGTCLSGSIRRFVRSAGVDSLRHGFCQDRSEREYMTARPDDGYPATLQGDEADRVEEIGMAMRRLRLEDRRLIGLRYGLDGGDESTISGVAEVVGISRNTAKWALHRIRGEMREALTP